MSRSVVVALSSVLSLGMSSCATESCACSPAVGSAMVTGSVLGPAGTPVPGTRVVAFSAPAADCHSFDVELGLGTAADDGDFRLALWGGPQDAVCLFVFARPPRAGEGMRDSDTAFVVVNFRTDPAVESAHVELFLRAE